MAHNTEKVGTLAHPTNNWNILIQFKNPVNPGEHLFHVNTGGD